MFTNNNKLNDTNTTVGLVKQVRDIINSENNHSPYHWVHIANQYNAIKDILQTDGLDKHVADRELTHSLMDIYLKRSAKLLEIKAPIDVLLFETESFQLSVNSIKVILFNDCNQATRDYYETFSSNQESGHE